MVNLQNWHDPMHDIFGMLFAAVPSPGQKPPGSSATQVQHHFETHAQKFTAYSIDPDCTMNFWPGLEMYSMRQMIVIDMTSRIQSNLWANKRENTDASNQTG